VPVGTHLWIYGRTLVLNDGTTVAEIPWLQHLKEKAGNAVEEVGHCLKTYGAEALVMTGNVAVGCAMGAVEGAVPFSEAWVVPHVPQWEPGRDFKMSEGLCETAVAALLLYVGWGELNTALRGGVMVPRLALATGRGTMAARSTAATFELVDQCAKTGYLLANASNINPGIKKVEEAATRDTQSGSHFGPARSQGFQTDSEAEVQANKLGFSKIKERSQGCAVFRRGNRYITRDRDGHNGGAWKMADSVENLASKKTRSGTYNADLTQRIGD
jgi:hypothetical protein